MRPNCNFLCQYSNKDYWTKPTYYIAAYMVLLLTSLKSNLCQFSENMNLQSISFYKFNFIWNVSFVMLPELIINFAYAPI